MDRNTDTIPGSLQSLMVIPREPSPDPVEDLSLEEARERVRQLEANRKIKQEHGPRVKRERPQSMEVPMRPMKTSRMGSGETLYHLDSDDESDGIEIAKDSALTNKPIEVVDLS